MAMSFGSTCYAGQKRAARYCNFQEFGDGPAGSLATIDDFRHGLVADFILPHTALMQSFFGPPIPILVARDTSGAYYDIAQGVVVLGGDFIERLANEKPGLARLAGVIAHEKTHYYQVTEKLDSLLVNDADRNLKHLELHADYCAGCYFAFCARHRKTAVGKLSELFYHLGGTDTGNFDFHGTEKERWFAFTRGYKDFDQILREKPLARVREAALAGLLFMRDELKAEGI